MTDLVIMREPRTPKLPAALAEAQASMREDQAVNLIVELIDYAREQVTTEESRLYLEQFFYEALCGRKTLAAAIVIEWADAGYPAADKAVRRYGGEIIDQHRETELTSQARAQLVKILTRPFIPYPRGRHVVANMLRDLWLPRLMLAVATSLHIPATRNPGGTVPVSAASLVAKALKIRGIKLKERQLNRIYTDRRRLAAELEGSMPPIRWSAADVHVKA